MTLLFTLEIRYEQDVVQARQQTRELAAQLGFDMQDQTRLATAVSEIARNAFQYAQGGRVQFEVEERSQTFLIEVRDQGGGIAHLNDVLAERYQSATGIGLGIVGTRRLMDSFEIESSEQGTTVRLGKTLPARWRSLSEGESLPLTDSQIQQIRAVVLGRSPQNPYDEIQRQNQELLRAMAELRQREEELTRLNRELEDTNRGVIALYAELDEKASSLQQANELKTRFLSNMSHEFRTPLNSILSLSRMLLALIDGELSLEQEKQVTFIQTAATGLSELVNDLLDLAKVEAGKTEVHPSTFAVGDLFATLRGMLRPLLVQGAAVSLVFDEPEGLPPLYSDEGKIAQILRNFISNALKFTERGEVRVTAEQVGQMMQLSVSDTGIGIAAADQERIFEDFVQIESALQRQVKGTGLGLPISRKLAELMGGSVSVHSELGQGSRFSVCIPIVCPQVAALPDSLQPLSDLNPARLPVLAIEDHIETLFIYEKHLQASRYQLIAARTLAQARQALAQIRPAAIVLDILLEGQNGWTFLRELKGDGATRSIPVLVATVVDNEKQAIALGADGFLIKPVEQLPLLTRLNRLVGQGRAQKLLLIDDDPAYRYVVKQLLIHMPLQFLEAASGQEGLAMAEREQPTAILLDLEMPDLNGLDALEQLRHHPATRAIPVIIHSSNQLPAETGSRLAHQGVAILPKEKISQAEAASHLRAALAKAGFVLDA